MCAAGKVLGSSEWLKSLGAAASSAREPDPTDPGAGLVGPVHIEASGRGRRREKSLWCLPSLVQVTGH